MLFILHVVSVKRQNGHYIDMILTSNRKAWILTLMAQIAAGGYDESYPLRALCDETLT
jgi:hypothetical protein